MKSKLLLVLAALTLLSGCASLGFGNQPEAMITETYDPTTGVLLTRSVPASLYNQVQSQEFMSKQLDVQMARAKSDEAVALAIGSQQELSDVESVALLLGSANKSLGHVLNTQANAQMMDAQAKIKGPVDIQLAKIDRSTRLLAHLLPRPTELFNVYAGYKAVKEREKTDRELYRSFANAGKTVNISHVSASGTMGGGEGGGDTNGGDVSILIDSNLASDNGRIADSFYGPVQMANDYGTNFREKTTDPFNNPGAEYGDSCCDGTYGGEQGGGFLDKRDPTQLTNEGNRLF